MEMLSQKVGQSGGDIFKFAGDAMLVLWTPASEENKKSLKEICFEAIQTALEIQEGQDDILVDGETSQAVKIGFGVGEVKIAYVGGVLGRSEYLPIGNPLRQAFECETQAPGGGVVIIPEAVKAMLDDNFVYEKCDRVDAEHTYLNGPYYYVKGQNVQKKVTSSGAHMIRSKWERFDLLKLRKKVETFLPKSLLPFQELDQEGWSRSQSKLSICFASLDIDQSNLEDANGLKNMNQMVVVVQRCLYQNRGSLNKFLMDDKGSTLIFMFGVTFLYVIIKSDTSKLSY